jgi:outer membrane protein assembly factor BamD (BamD/ComL family)
MVGEHTVTSRAGLLLAALALAVAVGCVTDGSRVVPGGTLEPDKFLFDKGNAALAAKKWLTAREYFKQVVETYTGSSYRPDAKLAVGDTYLGEGTSEALVLAINEFTEFLSFYPTNKRADYAQYKLGSPISGRCESRSATRPKRAKRLPNSARS